MAAGISWIDFSTEDRNRITSKMSLLREGVLDELGIGVMRDGISGCSFPRAFNHTDKSQIFLIHSSNYQAIL